MILYNILIKWAHLPAARMNFTPTCLALVKLRGSLHKLPSRKGQTANHGKPTHPHIVTKCHYDHVANGDFSWLHCDMSS